ncbi:hypothetical protein [Aeromonas sobria]|uniref:hypothetical protein n=1 Tax=Aeromonas sobria TaxID=646 RepID=UPI0011172758|nr:hypothetical protein [Aeromonas sobria]TNH80474.1 hypothetical protein CF140_15730 [Aeromonas sobria]
MIMSYYIYNVVGFVVFFLVAGFSALLLIGYEKKNFFVTLLLGTFTVYPGYLSWICFKGIINGDQYEAETSTFLKSYLEGRGQNGGSDIELMAIHAGFNAFGFKLEELKVDPIWQGKWRFNNEKLPYNLYEVNTVWRNRAEGKKDKRCFLYAWANDIENGYRRHIKLYEECDKRDDVIKEIESDPQVH